MRKTNRKVCKLTNKHKPTTRTGFCFTGWNLWQGKNIILYDGKKQQQHCGEKVEI